MKIPEHVPWKSTGKTLGSGGQGVVEVVTPNDNPQVPKYALKRLRNVGSTQAQERFQREIGVVKTLTHPSIIRVYDHSDKDDEFLYYVMEYHEGARTLAKIIYSQSNPYYRDTPTLQRQPETLHMDKNRRPNSQQTRSPLCQSGIIGLNFDPVQ